MPHQLIQRIVARDETALADLYTAYGAQVFGVALHVVQDAKLAEEVAQDTFLKVWHGAAQWDSARGSVGAWLMTIARFTAIDLLRREKKYTTTFGLPLEEFLIAAEPYEDIESSAEAAGVLQSMIGQLPPEQIEAIELAFLRGMTHSEIAEHLGEPLGTVKSRIRNGLQTLKGMWIRQNTA